MNMAKDQVPPSSAVLLGNKPFSSSPIAYLTSPFSHPSFQYLSPVCILLVAIFFRLVTGLGPYSGLNTPPMFGDFEAQRHWMEITLSLPLKSWYNYDTNYWGLDYPPLSAYLAYALGKIARKINPSWVALDSSRGFESLELKNFMRFTVLACDVLLFMPGVLYYCRYWRHRNKLSINEFSIASSLILLNPAFLLIDHGHFQYNTLMLGLTLSTICNILDRNYALSALVFVLAIGFKQMSLYYSPVVFFFLLGISTHTDGSIIISRLLRIATATIASFCIIFLPFFIKSGTPGIVQIIQRIFPFERGIWEDKVANFWCSTNIFIKFKQLYTLSTLKYMALSTTLCSIAPACYYSFTIPSRRILPYLLAACSLSFFLFSFQAHEKTILLPLFPITLLFIGCDHRTKAWCGYFSIMSTYSLWPLLKRENLHLQFFTLLLFYIWLGNFYDFSHVSLYEKIVFVGSYATAILLWILEFFWSDLPTLLHKPDLYVLLNCLVSFGAFLATLIWLNTMIMSKSMLHEP